MALYNNPDARMQATLGRNPTAEEMEIASQISNKGLGQALNQMGGGQPPMGGGQPPQQPPMGGGQPLVAQSAPISPVGPDSGEPPENIKDEVRAMWGRANENEPVPWNRNTTWGDYLGELFEKYGKEAVDQVIDQQLQNERDSGESQEPQPPGLVPPGPFLDAGAPNVPATPELQQATAPVSPTSPVPEGILQAAGGGYVDRGTIAGELRPRGDLSVREAGETEYERFKRLHGYDQGGYVDRSGVQGYALGGLEGQGAPVGEEEFLSVAGDLAGQAGIPTEAIQAISESVDAGPPANDNVLESGIMQTVEPEVATEADMGGIGQLAALNEGLVEMGEEGLVHATPGEIVFDPALLSEKDQKMLYAALDAEGIDPARLTVGDPSNVLNEMTGLPAFGLFSSIGKFFRKAGRTISKGVRKVGRFIKKNAGTILGIAGAMTGNPLLAALGSGIGSLVEGKPIQSALISAGLGFAGTEWVGPWIGEQVAGLSSTLGAAGSTGQILGETAQSAGLGELGTSLTQGAADAVAYNTVMNRGAEAAAKELLAQGTQKSALKATTDVLANYAKDAVGHYALPSSAIDATAKNILNSVTGDIASKSLTTAAVAAAPQSALSSGVGGLLARPMSQTLGSAIAGIGQKYVEPMAQAYAQGVPSEEEAELIAAFNAKYNYTPSSQELIQFYNTEYSPPPAVDIAQRLGTIPGYAPLTAAGGGYINGVGGPKSDSNLALLSDGEFVFTEAAVRGADPTGMGDRLRGATAMYNNMQDLERRVA